MDVDAGDDAAVAVLHRLTLAGDDELALRVGGRIETRESGPAEKAEKEQRRDDQAVADVVAGVGDGRGGGAA